MSQHSYRTQTWVSPKQVFGPSPTHGVGAFALAPIHKGEVVEIVGGTVMTEAEFRVFQEHTPGFNAIQIDEALHLVEAPDVTQQRAGGLLNHSCDSNLWMADAVTLIARRDIPEGEELTVDYALFTVAPHWLLDQPCNCGADLCRHTVTGNDWQLPTVQQRYYPHFAPFVNARIDRLRSEQSSQAGGQSPIGKNGRTASRITVGFRY